MQFISTQQTGKRRTGTILFTYLCKAFVCFLVFKFVLNKLLLTHKELFNVTRRFGHSEICGDDKKNVAENKPRLQREFGEDNSGLMQTRIR